MHMDRYCMDHRVVVCVPWRSARSRGVNRNVAPYARSCNAGLRTWSTYWAIYHHAVTKRSEDTMENVEKTGQVYEYNTRTKSRATARPCQTRNWELQVQFKVHGRGKDLFGDGFAIWYVRERMHNGPVFGSKDYFEGLAIILDTYSNHNGAHNHQHPYISAMINNGSLHYDHDRDGTHTQVSGCEAKFRNYNHDTHISITYMDDTLTVSTDLEGKNAWKECLKVENVLLPTGYYFGASATTGDLSDNHDIIAIKMFELDLLEAQNKDEDRSKIIPSAASFEAPRERIDDSKPAMSGVKTFLYMMCIAIVIIVLVVLGIMWYQKRQEQSRKRLY